MLVRRVIQFAAAAAAVTSTLPLEPAFAQEAQSALPASLHQQLDRQYERVIADLIRITETPAPPFKEAERAALFADMLRDAGLADVSIDEEGNVIALRPGSAEGPVFVVSAHLDTVFPEDTPITVTRDGDRLMAPGIGDDSLGLASILAWVRLLEANRIATRQPVLFVGTVGEEGAGDLRGVRHLFTKGAWKDRIGAFLSIDGTDAGRVVHAAVGSRRYRLAFNGPGGHSYGAFGIVNPMAAMAGTVTGIYAIDVPGEPKTTYSASVVSGGTSVNAIPDRVVLEIDMRSGDPAELGKLEQGVLAAAEAAVAQENSSRSTRAGQISLEPELIGDRPAGATPVDHPLVQMAVSASQAAGFRGRLDDSSTDSNIPMSLGIPALTIGSGAGGGRSHSLAEYLAIDRDRFVAGLSVGLAVILAQTGGELP
ncbi:M20/M25/M40 family metallo-hydrolase [Erythrobacter dokdonensis]|uniref:Peptidase n=1 Tax=Erythrobacter dokdonensis DSW-74 TaxID=1300349 RepID=A0A1A7BJI7_9SPHN|nr:M20/M25/M40 family metallo-hydrolase [Erythrobacter dokdonensis]OBV12639.1 Peptidase [Erythrobacter dokdonensis DSW-74]